MRVQTVIALSVFLITVVSSPAAKAEQRQVKVGVATVLSGDLAILGSNIAKTVETYKKRYLRHPISFEFEDARIGSRDGLNAYYSLIDVKGVDVLIGGTSSNGTLAAAPLINQRMIPLITPLTGGSNIDAAGPFIFRIGNSDILNGYQQADYFIDNDIQRVALLTEETEYTQDIAKFFRERFKERGGELVYDENFFPQNTDFRTDITKIKAKAPQALFMSTQTGLAFGLFIKQFRELGGQIKEIHTNFLAASNSDAFKAAGESIYGVHYMAPIYSKNSPELIKFFEEYRDDHQTSPAIPFHSAGTVDALNLLQLYLDKHTNYSAQGFKEYLLSTVKNYKGLMGTYSFDKNGNADIGFELTVIAKEEGIS